MKNTVIIGFSNPTKEGITLHLNNHTTLKGGTMHSKEFYVSWDKIGKALFDSYCEDLSDLNGLRKLRKEVNNDSRTIH